MHEIVKQFIFTDERLSTIVKQHFDPQDPLEKAFFQLAESFMKAEPEPSLYELADVALLKGHKDLDLFVLYMAFYSGFCWARSQKTHALSIYKLGLTIDLSKCHLITRLYYFVSVDESERLIHKNAKSQILDLTILKQIPEDTPRRATLLFNVATVLSNIGRLEDIKDKLVLLDLKHDAHKYTYADAALINSIITGNAHEAQHHLISFKKLYPIDDITPMKFREDLIRILQLDFNLNMYNVDELKKYAEAYAFITEKKFDLAEKAYQESLEKSHGEYFVEAIQKFIPLHIELNRQNAGKARLLLFEIKEQNDYMLDFFRVRLALLEDEKEKASFYFQRLLANIQRYKAFGRLAFEMKFSHELENHDLLNLSKDILLGFTYPTGQLQVKKIEEDLELDDTNDVKMIGKSPQIKEILRSLTQYADLEETVYIHGETGTGKELVARALHEKSLRKNEPFLIINCGTLTDTLLESELFGHEIGSFTGAHKTRTGIFESAGKGTVFLDEFGEISHRLQVALLRVLENREIRPVGSNITKKIFCRVVVASNKDIRLAVEEKRFREDLYYRINLFDIYLPPLRERKEDIPLLLQHYINLKSTKPTVLSNSLLSTLSAYHWPGNIRELKNEMERCRIINKGKQIIDLTDFDFSRLRQSDETKNQQQNPIPTPTQTEPIVNFSSVNNDRIQGIIFRPNKADQRLEYLKRLFQEHKKLTRAQIIEILQISPSTATRNLDLLLQENFIKKVAPSKNTRSHYFLLNE